MEPGLQRASRGSLFVVAAALLLLRLAVPLQRAYMQKLVSLHGRGFAGLAAGAAIAVFAVLWLGLRRHPRMTLAGVAALGLAMTALSGNLAAALTAALLCTSMLMLGDRLFRLLRGADAEQGDLSAVFAAGLAGAGLFVVILSEAGRLRPSSLALVALAVVVLSVRRIPELARLFLAAVRLPRGGAPAALESAWLAFVVLILLAIWAAVQAPDVSWDALAYHLPEARDIAQTGSVRPIEDLSPQSFLWRNHDAMLALGFFAGGERVVRFLQFAAAFAVFPATLSLARRIGGRGASPLVALALAGFPTAMLQLKSAYVDWPAALLVAASAAQIAVLPAQSGRLRVAGFLFGAAVATKIFALFAVPALAILLWRSRPRLRAVGGAAAAAVLALAPWVFWSATSAGSVFAPYARSAGDLIDRAARGSLFTTSPATGTRRPRVSASGAVVGLVRLPYDLVFHSSRFEANGDGYNGILVLLLLLGLAGWTRRHVLLFFAAALPFVVPWSLLYSPSVRFLFPVYPLYAAFCSEGLTRLTGRFTGAAGAAAGIAILAAAAAFPVQFGSSGLETRAAFGRIGRDEFLETALPSYALWKNVGPSDRVVLMGENDRYHCPAQKIWRSEFLPVSSWGDDPEAWSRGLDTLGATHLMWRRDRRPDGGAIPWLPDRLETVASNPSAVLYRIVPRWPEPKR